MGNLEARAAAIWQQALDETPTDIMDGISEIIEARMLQLTGVHLPGAVRRLAASTASRTGILAYVTVHSVREQAVQMCEMDDECRADMPNANSVTLPLWAFILIVAAGGTAVLLAGVLAGILAGILMLQRRRPKDAAKATATAPAAPQTVDVCDAA